LIPTSHQDGRQAKNRKRAQIWFSGFRGEDLNVIFYQNMPNLHNQHKSAERKISKKNPRTYAKLLPKFVPKI
jgi:coproporphyrinogen III oxidase